jgi:TetR/AcrR family transcriptional regulator, regulator of biofilm formation and stress response
MLNSGTGSSERSTRERILEATVALMAEIGIDRVRTRAVAERAGVNPALVHYHFGSMSALVLEAAEHALIHELGPSIDAFASGSTIEDGIVAILAWIEDEGRTPGSTILAEAMVKSTRDPAFRDWSTHASRRFRALILERLQMALDAGEIDQSLELESTAVLLAAALDGLLFHRLVDPTLEVSHTHALFESMLRPRAPAGPRRRPKH